MQKNTIIIFSGIVSFAIMGCSLFRFAQINLQPTASPQEKLISPASEAGETPKALVDSPQTANPLPTATPLSPPDPLTASQECVANTWEIAGLNEYILAAIPPELAAEYNLEYQGTDGHAYFELSPEGEFTLRADEFKILFSAQALVFSLPVVVQIDGIATGNYEIDTTTLTISDVDTQQISASAQALGEDLVDPEQIIGAVPFIKPPYNTANYTCQGDRLELEFSNYPGEVPPLVFQGVSKQ